MITFEEDTSFYIRNVDGENHEGKEAGFQDSKEFMPVEMKGIFVNAACSSESKEDAVSVETDSRQETDKEEAEDMKTIEKGIPSRTAMGFLSF